MDVSGSMRSTDVSPTRLDAAKASALSFIDQLPAGVRVGVVSFASEPVTLVTPTTDRTQLKAAINGLTARDGTAMGDALMQVLDIAQKIQADGTETPDASPAPAASAAPGSSTAPGSAAAPGSSAVPNAASKAPLVATILLSDGANSVGEAKPLDAAQRARALGVPIYTIALGTPDGVVDVQNQYGETVTLDVPPDTATLEQIASITGGTAFNAPTAEQLSSVYDNLQSRVGYTEERQEVTFALVGAGLLLVVLGAGMSAVWFGRLP
jgi:Ca-activated chloride channel family protein